MQVNVEKILEVAEAIGSGREVCPTQETRVFYALPKQGSMKVGFNMSVWGPSNEKGRDRSGHNCGTVACIGGWTNLLNGQSPSLSVAAETLGLDRDTAMQLFHAEGSDLGDPKLTVKRAVAVLRHLAETGKVCWHLFDQNGVRL